MFDIVPGRCTNFIGIKEEIEKDGVAIYEKA